LPWILAIHHCLALNPVKQLWEQLKHSGLTQFACAAVETSGFKTCGGDFIYAL
jgi:hypothetical protein